VKCDIQKCEKIKLRIMEKKYCLITNLGTILVGFQQGFVKTNPYVYQLILTCKKNKYIDTFIGSRKFENF
jgi:hypothetical protein